jgi:hypothetical protein
MAQQSENDRMSSCCSEEQRSKGSESGYDGREAGHDFSSK